MYLPHDVNHKTTILTILTNHLAHMQFDGLPTSPEGLDAIQVQEKMTCPVCPELDDETNHQHNGGNTLPTAHMIILLHLNPTHIPYGSLWPTPPCQQTS